MTAPPTPGEPTLAEAVEAVETIVRAYQPRSGPASAARDAAYAALPALRSAAEREAKSAGLPEAFSDATGTIKALTAELASAAEREKALVENLNTATAGILPMYVDDGSSIVCSAISGGADYSEGAPRRLTLDVTEAGGNGCPVAYVQESTLASLRSDLERVRGEKDGAYDERNRLVALLASVFPSSLERHPEDDKEWEDDWRWIVFIDLPTGQASWHIHDSQMPLFGNVAPHGGRSWDGHTTDEKYERVKRACFAAPAVQQEEQSDE